MQDMVVRTFVSGSLAQAVGSSFWPAATSWRLLAEGGEGRLSSSAAGNSYCGAAASRPATLIGKTQFSKAQKNRRISHRDGASWRPPSHPVPPLQPTAAASKLVFFVHRAPVQERSHRTSPYPRVKTASSSSLSRRRRRQVCSQPQSTQFRVGFFVALLLYAQAWRRRRVSK